MPRASEHAPTRLAPSGPTIGIDTDLEAVRREPRRQLLLLVRDQGVVNIPEDVVGVKNTQLFHNHLPMLEHLGYIDWDRVTDDVTAGRYFDRLDDLLSLVDPDDTAAPDRRLRWEKR